MAHAFDFDRPARHLETKRGGIISKAFLDPMIFQFDCRAAAIAQKEHAIMGAFRVGAGDIAVEAFDFGDQILRHQEIQCAIYSWRGNSLAGFDTKRIYKIVSTHRLITSPQQFQHLPSCFG